MAEVIDFKSVAEERRLRHMLEAESSIRLIELEAVWIVMNMSPKRMAILRAVMASRGMTEC